MKDSTAALKDQMKAVSIDEIEDTMDDMQDLLEDTNEIQEVASLKAPAPAAIPQTRSVDSLLSTGEAQLHRY